jgi:hypothetical protein
MSRGALAKAYAMDLTPANAAAAAFGQTCDAAE